MRNTKTSIASLTIAAAALATAYLPAHAAGNADRGREIAEQWCAACHDITPNTVTRDPGRPATFQEIADTPGMGELALKVFFQTSHKEMPNFTVTDQVRDDLIAYITSLKSS